MKTKVVNIMSPPFKPFEQKVDFEVNYYCNEQGYDIKYISPVQPVIQKGTCVMIIQTIVFQKK